MAFAAVIPYIIAAGAVVSAVGAIQQGQAAKAASKYNAQVQMQNAQLARQEAQKLYEQQSRENYLRLGAIHANAGKAGGAGDAGSVLDVIGDVASQGEMQKQQILYGGELKARDYTNTAILDEAHGRFAQRAGYMQAGADLLQGAGNAYSTGLLKRGSSAGSSSGVSNYSYQG